MKKYYKRYIEKEIEKLLKTSGAVVIEGPKFCGKSTTSEKFAESKYVLDTKAKIELAQSNPNDILIGEHPRLIDEWQMVPDLWNCARTNIDNSKDKFGKFIFTGSSTPVNKNDIYHSGAGRIVKIKMRTLSLFESEESTGEVSLKKLFEGKEKVFSTNDNYSLYDTAFYICRGGWPLSLVKNKEKALQITNNYVSTLFEFENHNNEKFRNKKKNLFIMILKSYARNISSEARRSKMLNDVIEHEDRKLDDNTFDEYVEALNDLYIIEDIEAWNPNFRSKTTITSTPTRHFIDTSIATGILNMSPNDLMNDPESFGLFFEDFVVKELNIYTKMLDGEIRHYRDNNGLECDAVIHLKNGNFALVEIKLGGESLVNNGISTLKKLKEKLLKEKKKEPTFMMIVTAVGNAYTTKDGIYVVPINKLKD